MILDLRFVLRNEPLDDEEELKKSLGKPYIGKAKKILQAYDGYIWYDVPFEEKE